MSAEENSGPFILRVYGLIFSNQNHILTTKEWYGLQWIIKFPGGGLKLGEGTKEALSREINEELNIALEPELWNHYYTTDFYQPSAFDPKKQVMSIYYRWPVLFEHEELENIIYKNQVPSDKLERFYLKNLDYLNPQEFTLPIDRHVASMLVAHN